MPYKLSPFLGNFDETGGEAGPPGPATLILDGSTNTVFSIAADVLGAVDPGSADVLLFWDDSAGGIRHLSLGSGLSISGTTISSTAGGANLSLGTHTSTALDVLSDSGTDVTLPAATTSLAGLFTGADKTKLDDIATGATANSSDATLLNRANHTGTQAVGTITGLGGAATLNVGSTASTVCAGDDARLSDARTPTAHNQAWSTITSTPTTRSGYGITDAAGNGAITASGLTQATARLIGRTTASAGAPEEISVSADLSLSTGVLGVGSSVATLTGTQTLSNKTLQETKVVQFTIVDGASVDLDPANGGVQLWTLGANRTATATNFEDGQSMTVLVDDGATYSLTWPTTTWLSGSPPTLSTTGYTPVELFKAGGTLYGAPLVAGAGGGITAHASTHATGQADELTPANIGAATAAQGAKADTALQVVNHAVDASVARPTGAPAVYWIGTVEPVNALDGDLWIGGV